MTMLHQKSGSFGPLMAGLFGYALGASQSRVITQTRNVEVPVYVPVHIEPSQIEMAERMSPAVSLWFVTFYHLAGEAERIAKKEGVDLTGADRALAMKYLTKARGHVGNELSSMMQQSGMMSKMAPVLELMEIMFKTLKEAAQRTDDSRIKGIT